MSVSENHLRDVKASIACEIAKIMPKGERIDAVCKMLRIEEEEARSLIMRGRRLDRDRSNFNAIGDAAA
jgi:hypothetical protein